MYGSAGSPARGDWHGLFFNAFNTGSALQHTTVEWAGRFTGGYITRTYGDPRNDVHAVQLEQAQCSYMNEEAPYEYREDLAEGVRPTLRALLESMLEWSKTQS